MKIQEGTCKINGVQLTEITVKSMPNAQLTMDAVYALGEASGKGILVGTHGRCTAYTQNWSKDTIKLLNKLLDSMEKDLLPRHFEKTAGMEDTNEGIRPREDEDADQI